MSLKNLSELDEDEIQTFLDSFDDVLCDCDDVLWKIDTSLDGASEAIKLLQERGKKVNFVSNNCIVGLENYLKKFKAFKIDADESNLLYPTLAIITYLKEIKFDREIFLLGPTAMKADLTAAGFKVKEFNQTAVLQESPETIYGFFKGDESVGAVIVDFDINLNYEKIAKAVSILCRPDMLLLGGATESILRLGTGKVLIGPGCFQNMLQEASGKKIMSFGKPSKILNEYVAKKFKIEDPSRTLFIGDSLDQDIGFAINSGYQNLLVLGGVTTLDKAESSPKESRPDYYLASLGDMIALINNKAKVEL